MILMPEFPISNSKFFCLVFFLKAKNTNASIAITANPGFEFSVIFKNIYAYRMSLAWKGCDPGETGIVYFKYLHEITAIAGNE